MKLFQTEEGTLTKNRIVIKLYIMELKSYYLEVLGISVI